jgi:imidazolonepropionase
MWDLLFLDANLAAMTAGAPYGAALDAALGVKDGRIVYAGAASQLPGLPQLLASKVERLDGAWITPGLIDCHTHLVFAGDRSEEFEERLKGATYEEIAHRGGGIASTVKATRAAGIDELTELAAMRLKTFAAQGATTVEVKSGYGLDFETELKMLEAARKASFATGVRVRKTLLAMHALPPEFKSDRAGYVRMVCDELLSEAKRRGLVDAVDAFCERIAFSQEETRTLFEAAKGLGIPIKLHAEQLSDSGGAGLAAEYNALSADHLEYINERDIAAMAKSETVAVLLPGAFYFLKETKRPPTELLRKHGVRMAIATDFNPGSAPLSSPTLAMNMACTLFGLTPEEALAGMTRNAAAALGMTSDIGTLETGKVADLSVWRIARPGELAYWMGGLGPERVFASGREIHGKPQ